LSHLCWPIQEKPKTIEHVTTQNQLLPFTISSNDYTRQDQFCDPHISDV